VKNLNNFRVDEQWNHESHLAKYANHIVLTWLRNVWMCQCDVILFIFISLKWCSLTKTM